MDTSLGLLYKNHPQTALRAIQEVLSLEGFTYEAGKFPLIWVKESLQGVEVLCFYSPLKLSLDSFSNREFLVSPQTKKRIFVEKGMMEQKQHKSRVPLALFQGSDEIQVLIPYQVYSFQGSLQGPFKGEDQVIHLMNNPQVNYLTQEFVKHIYYQLGLPHKNFDNLGMFWKNGFTQTIEQAAFKKIA